MTDHAAREMRGTQERASLEEALLHHPNWTDQDRVQARSAAERMPVVAWYVWQVPGLDDQGGVRQRRPGPLHHRALAGRVTFPEGAPDGLGTYETGGGYAILPLSNHRDKAPRET